LPRFLAIRDEAIEVLEDANRDLSVRRSEYGRIIEGRARLLRLLMPIRRISIGPPMRFSPSTAKPISGRERRRRRTVLACLTRSKKSPPSMNRSRFWSRDDLRRAIEASQAVLVDQVQAIHDEFERAFASYREIDDLVEEKAIAGSNA